MRAQAGGLFGGVRRVGMVQQPGAADATAEFLFFAFGKLSIPGRRSSRSMLCVPAAPTAASIWRFSLSMRSMIFGVSGSRTEAHKGWIPLPELF